MSFYRGQSQYEKKVQTERDEEAIASLAQHCLRFCNVSEFVEENPEVFAEIDIEPLIKASMVTDAKGIVMTKLYVKLADSQGVLNDAFDPYMNLSLFDKLMKLGEMRIKVADVCYLYDKAKSKLSIDMTLALANMESLLGWKISDKVRRVYQAIGTEVVLAEKPIRINGDMDDLHVYMRITGKQIYHMIPLSKPSPSPRPSITVFDSARSFLFEPSHKSPKSDDDKSHSSRRSSFMRFIGSTSSAKEKKEDSPPREELIAKYTTKQSSDVAENLSVFSGISDSEDLVRKTRGGVKKKDNSSSIGQASATTTNTAETDELDLL